MYNLFSQRLADLVLGLTKNSDTSSEVQRKLEEAKCELCFYSLAEAKKSGQEDYFKRVHFPFEEYKGHTLCKDCRKQLSKYKVSSTPTSPVLRGFVDPSGSYWDMDERGHGIFASWILLSKYGSSGVHWDDSPDVIVERYNWVRTSGGSVVMPKRMTQAQKDVIFDWLASHRQERRFYDGKGVLQNLDAKKFLEIYGSLFLNLEHRLRNIQSLDKNSRT